MAATSHKNGYSRSSASVAALIVAVPKSLGGVRYVHGGCTGNEEEFGIVVVHSGRFGLVM